jgi:hypothetical protein
MIGLARGSPIWNLFFESSTTDYYYQIVFQNSTDWTFADPNYQNSTYGGNNLTLGSGIGVIADY